MMKQQKKRWVALMLSLIMCISMITPVQAANYTAALTPETISVAQSDKDQTVIVTLVVSGAVSCEMFQFVTKTELDACVESVSLGGSDLERLNESEAGGNESVLWFYNKAVTGAQNLGTIKVKIPAGTAVGEYTVSVENIQFEGSNDQITSVTPAVIRVTEASAPPVTPSGSYTASVSAPASATVGDENVAFTIAVDGDSFASAQMAFTYDHDKLSLLKVEPGSWSEAADGTVTVVDFGAEKIPPKSYTATFKALRDGAAVVTLNSAFFGKADSADSENAAAATITAASDSVNIAKRSYSVTLPDIFNGESTVEEGADYTFWPVSANYTYSNVKVSVNGGEAQSLAAADDGSYTVENVTGNLVITGERNAKSYTITFTSSSGVSVPVGGSVTYGTDYTFTIPTEANYDVTVKSIKIGENDVAYTTSGKTVTIPGANITGNIVVTMERERNNAIVTIPSSLNGVLLGSATAQPGVDYTVTLQRDNRYNYEVTATVSGETVTLTQEGDKFTIAGANIKAGDNIAFTVTKTLRTDKLTVERYLQVDGAVLYLVRNEMGRETENVYTYNGTEMYWSAKYNAYCCLVIANTLDEAKSGTLELKAGSDTALAYGMDVNKSDKIDINDAQFVYNLYNAQYSSFTASATMEKMLLADTSGDGVVNVSDAQLIVNNILGISMR